MSKMLAKMNLISAVQQLPKEDVETVQGYVEMIEKENQELNLELSGYRQAILNNKEMLGLKEENQELKKQLEERKKMYQNAYDYSQKMEGKAIILEAQQKEFIKHLENRIDICNGFLGTVKSDLQEIPYGAISVNKTYITTQIKENEIAHKVYEEILQKYKEIIEKGDVR